MTRRHLRTAVFALAGLMVALPIHAQSLGDLAKRTQEQRDKAKDTKDGKDTKDPKDAKDPAAAKETTGAKEKKVFTDQDLKNLQPVVGGAPAAEGSATAGKTDAADASSATSGETPKDGAKGEGYWRARWKAANDLVTRDQELAATTRKRIDELTFQLRSLGHLTTGTGEMLSERQRLIAQEKVILQQVDADKAALTALQEEGRHAGALPGWFR